MSILARKRSARSYMYGGERQQGERETKRVMFFRPHDANATRHELVHCSEPRLVSVSSPPSLPFGSRYLAAAEYERSAHRPRDQTSRALASSPVRRDFVKGSLSWFATAAYSLSGVLRCVAAPALLVLALASVPLSLRRSDAFLLTRSRSWRVGRRTLASRTVSTTNCHRACTCR